jgi:hypothetical protein
MVWRDLGRHKPVRFAHRAGEIFCQNPPLTMKNGQNSAAGGSTANSFGDAVEPPARINFRANQLIRPVPVESVGRAVATVRIYYCTSAAFQGVYSILGGKILSNYLPQPSGIFCQTLQLTMKNTSRNTARPEFRQHEIGRQTACHTVGLVAGARSNRQSGKRLRRSRSILRGRDGYLQGQAVWHFEVKVIGIMGVFLVRIYYCKKPIYQTFCPVVTGITLFHFRTRQPVISVRLVA